MQSRFILPITIIIAGLTLATGLFIAKWQKPKDPVLSEKELLAGISPISENDYYLGNPAGEVILIEYSDYDCPFCASHFNNLRKIVEDLGKDGNLVWIHRHMPLYQIHPEAKGKANIVECAGSLGGIDKFWQSSEIYFRAVQEKRSVTLPDLSRDLNLPLDELESCAESKKFEEKVDTQYNEAFEAGARGTPFTVVIKGEERYAVAESLPYFELKKLVESLLSK